MNKYSVQIHIEGITSPQLWITVAVNKEEARRKIYEYLREDQIIEKTVIKLLGNKNEINKKNSRWMFSLYSTNSTGSIHWSYGTI